jgi:hypothetical protein
VFKLILKSLKRIFIVNLLILFFYSIVAQNVVDIKGVVVDKNGEPVERANVLLSAGNSDNDSIVDYTFTNKEGFFVLKRKKLITDQYLIIYSLGTKMQKVKINQTTGAINGLLHIKLEEKEYLLKEVVVRRERLPYSIRKDTVSYDVKSYIKPQDASVEDVLKKLPGIIVGETGDITYKGKKISRILINDMDIFNTNTKIASRNIGAELVDTIQVIENFSKNIILKGFDENKENVINLKLRKGLTSLFSNISTGVGSNNKTDLQANAYALNNTSGNIFIFNHNNTGKTIDKIGSQEEKDNEFKMDPSYSSALFSYEPSIPTFFDDLGIFNKLTFGNSNFNYKLKDNQEITGNVQGFFDVNHYSNYQDLKYTFAENPFSYSSSDYLKKESKFGKIDFMYSKISKDKSAFSSKFRYSLSNKNNLFSEEIIQDDSRNYLSGTIREKKTEFYNSTNYTITIDSSNVLIFNFNLFSGNSPQNVDFYTKNYFNENTDSTLYITSQASQSSHTYCSGTANYLVKFKGLTHLLKFSGGLVYSEQKLTSDLNDERISQTGENRILNDQLLKTTKFFLEGKYRYSVKKFKTAFIIKPTVLKLASTSPDDVRIINSRNYLFIEPSIVLTQEIPRNNFLFYSGIDYSVLGVNDLLQNVYIESPRRYMKGTEAFVVRSHEFMFNYSYSNLYRNTTLLLNVLYNTKTPGVGTKTVVSDELTYFEKTKKSGEKSLFVNAQMDKYLPFIESKMSVGYNLSYLEFQEQINESSWQKYFSTSNNYLLSLKSNFSAFLNYDFSLKYRTSLYAVKKSKDGNNSGIFEGKIRLNFDYEKRFMLSPLVSFYLSGYNSNVSPVVDFYCKYLLLNPKIAMELNFRNILNSDTFTQVNVSEYSRSTEVARIQNFYVLFKLSFYIPNKMN